MTVSYQQIKLANQHPLNQAARKFLPKDWQANEMTELHVLSLMRWGLDNGLKVKNQPDRPSLEEVESRINMLSERSPKEVMRFLLDPEKTGDVILDATELLEQETPLDAAGFLVEALVCSMEATARIY